MSQSSCLDCGDLSGPLLIFGGPYSNLQATRAMKGRAEALGIPPGRTFCTGDLVAYCAQPAQTVALIREWGIRVVMGNCEESLGFGRDDCGCGFSEGSVCDALSTSWYRYAKAHLGESERGWMQALPRQIRLRVGGVPVTLVHGGVGSINRFLYPSMSDEAFARELDLAATPVVIGGHSGLPFARPVGQRLWLNAGAIGMPANDGTREGWYLLLDVSGGALHYRFERLDYDAEAAAAAMAAEGLDTPYRQALLSGIWPSMDILPEAERQLVGIPRSPFSGRFVPLDGTGAAE